MLKKDRIHKFLHRVAFEDLSTDYLYTLVAMARDEDLRGFGLKQPLPEPVDVTSKIISPSGSGSARLAAREALTLCGLPLVPVILKIYDPELRFEPLAADSDCIPQGGILGKISGHSASMLMAERVLLNFLQFLSGVASQTHAYVSALGNSPTRILDTRKTTPGYRMLQKYAVACGGGWNHRLGLFDRVMLKDNHLAADSSQSVEALTELILKARQLNPTLLIEVEVDHLEQIPEVLKAGPDKIMLDNFSIDCLKQAVELIGESACTEATGGITLERLPELGALGLDFLSTGAPVHQAVWKDIGLDWD